MTTIDETGFAEPLALALERVLLSADMLIDLLDEETAALEAPREHVIAALQAEKERVLNNYSAALIELRADPDWSAKTPPAVRRALDERARILEMALADNEKKLKAATTATDRAIAAIITAIREQRLPTVGYTRRSKAMAQYAIAAGVTVNRSL